MPETIPCLWFDDQAEAAAEHYVSIFPNSEVLEVVRHPGGFPGTEGQVMTVVFSLDGQRYVGLNGGPLFTFSEAVSFQIMCADQAEVDRYWERLTDGGSESACGWLKDRFGVSWQVVPTRVTELMSDPDRDRARRAAEALSRMRKIDIAACERAAAG